VYQLVKKYNCHEPGRWRVGAHQAAGGQFLLCYRHHPDYQGNKPTHKLIQRLHNEHLERRAAAHGKVHEVHRHLIAKPAAANGAADPGAPAAPAANSGNPPPGLATLDGTGEPTRHTRSR